MDDAHELRRLRSRVRSAAHEMCNTLGIALNYLDFLGEDIAGTDGAHPVWQQVALIQDAIRRAVDTVRSLRDDVVPAEEEAALARELTEAAGAAGPPTEEPVG